MQIEKTAYRYTVNIEGKPYDFSVSFTKPAYSGEFFINIIRPSEVPAHMRNAVGEKMEHVFTNIMEALRKHDITDNFAYPASDGSFPLLYPERWNASKLEREVAAGMAEAGAVAEKTAVEVTSPAEQARSHATRITNKFKKVLDEAYPGNPGNGRAAAKMAQTFDGLFEEMRQENYQPKNPRRLG